MFSEIVTEVTKITCHLDRNVVKWRDLKSLTKSKARFCEQNKPVISNSLRSTSYDCQAIWRDLKSLTKSEEFEISPLRPVS